MWKFRLIQCGSGWRKTVQSEKRPCRFSVSCPVSHVSRRWIPSAGGRCCRKETQSWRLLTHHPCCAWIPQLRHKRPPTPLKRRAPAYALAKGGYIRGGGWWRTADPNGVGVRRRQTHPGRPFFTSPTPQKSPGPGPGWLWNGSGRGPWRCPGRWKCRLCQGTAAGPGGSTGGCWRR